MGNCKDCKWWKTPDDPKERGLCSVIGDLSDPKANGLELAVIQCEGFDRRYAELWTLADFGCVQFEQREA